MEQNYYQEKPAIGPTLEELHQAFLKGGKEEVSRMLTRADGEMLIPSPEDLAVGYNKFGQPMLEALMWHIDRAPDEPEDYEPEWTERRWR